MQWSVGSDNIEKTKFMFTGGEHLMFTDGRSKKVIFIAHCLLNQNSISDGTAVYPAAFKEMIGMILDGDIGIVQMPCPELCCLGLDRGNIYGADSPIVQENTRIRYEMMQPDTLKKLHDLVDSVVYQIMEYKKYGFDIIGIVGANRSPNCGIDSTSDHNEEIAGMGLFMGGIYARLKEEKIYIPMMGIKGSDNIMDKMRVFLKIS